MDPGMPDFTRPAARFTRPGRAGAPRQAPAVGPRDTGVPRRQAVFLALCLGAMVLMPGVRASTVVADAPLTDLDAVESATAAIVARLAAGDLPAALADMRRHANDADTRVVQHFDEVAASLPAALGAKPAGGVSERVGREKFSFSFVRVSYTLAFPTGRWRFMFTWRKKPRGWRLNQCYFARG
ncbi:MAG: hypothetical protein ACU85V_11740 [Gammaproteobacteria bacterium]